LFMALHRRFRIFAAQEEHGQESGCDHYPSIPIKSSFLSLEFITSLRNRSRWSTSGYGSADRALKFSNSSIDIGGSLEVRRLHVEQHVLALDQV
jgi:hypothetical protein